VQRPTSRIRAKAEPRRQRAQASPFERLFEQLGRRSAAADGPASSQQVAARAWTCSAVAAHPWSPLAAAVALYVDAEATALRAAPLPSIEEAVMRELKLSEAHPPAELERIRRTFAYRNHPDRVGIAYKAQALQRMTIANVLIDRALARARAK
jgi:hypothetical protein